MWNDLNDDYPTKRDYIVTAIFSILWIVGIAFPFWARLL